MKNILVLCTGNSCRSQMAEGWIRYYAGNEVNVYSAGIEAHGLNNYAVKVMADALIDISKQTSKTTDDLPDIKFDYIITVCDEENVTCPFFPGGKIYIHKSFPDPTSIKGDSNKKIKFFTLIRNNIEEWIIDTFLTL